MLKRKIRSDSNGAKVLFPFLGGKDKKDATVVDEKTKLQQRALLYSQRIDVVSCQSLGLAVTIARTLCYAGD